jgi:hypothetical protein
MAWSIRRFFNYRGVRVITCPETNEGAAVSVDALQAAVSGSLRLSSCSRWPERAGCDQACLTQIKASPDGCLLRSIVTSWYAGKSCIECGRPIGLIVWHEAPPALRAPDGSSHQWSDFAPQDLPRLFGTYQPLCWHCNNVNELAHLHPDLVIERPHPTAPPPPPPRSDATY